MKKLELSLWSARYIHRYHNDEYPIPVYTVRHFACEDESISAEDMTKLIRAHFEGDESFIDLQVVEKKKLWDEKVVVFLND